MDIIKKNFSLSMWITRIAFIVCYVFGRWLYLRSFSVLMGETLGYGINVYGNFWFTFFTGILSALISIFVIRLLTIWIMRASRIYYLPFNEIYLFVILFAALKNLIVGILSLVYYIAPVVIGWGVILFDFVALLAATLGFYFFVNKNYVPEGNRANFFKLIFTLFVIFSIAKIALGVYSLV
ncbi:MAG TPA: hypothetical protein PK675_02210 [Clostridia bacterium]|nr:hypothetical protein [Clostridia bacterium]